MGLGWCGAASAAPPRRVDLSWESDPSCIDAASLATSVERALGRAVFHDPSPAFAVVEGEARHVGKRFEARVRLRAQGPTNTDKTLVTTGKCERLDESIAVVIALLIDSLDEPLPPAPPQPSGSAPPAPVLTVSDEPPRPAPPPAPSAAPALTIAPRASVRVSHGLLPGTTPMGTLSGRIEPAGLPSAILAVHGLSPRSSMDGDSGVSLSGWSAEGLVCPVNLAPAGLRASACAGAGASWLSASPVQLIASTTRSVHFAHASALASLSAPLLGSLWLSLDLGFWAPLRRDRFGFLRSDGTFSPVHSPSAIAPHASLGLELRPR